MVKPQYILNSYPVESIFTFIKSGDIAIPEIQRPFVWDAAKVRNFLDSLYRGYPVGFLIAWKNPNVVLKDGRSAEGKKILIDGQQRVTALMAALLGMEVVTKDYRKGRIRIAFHPLREAFEVANPAIAKSAEWIPDVATLFDPHVDLLQITADYCLRNPDITQTEILKQLMSLQKITTNTLGVIELSPELDIETVTDIFIRVNSEGVPLGQADFAMSRIAVDTEHGGSDLRKAIDYFCHLAKSPTFYESVLNDKAFAKTPYFRQISWLKHEMDDLYDPSYIDMLRVTFAAEFGRGKLGDLVALLSGRNFETKQFEEAITADSFARMQASVMHFVNEHNFRHFTQSINGAGFIDSSMIGSQNALNFAYALFLTLRGQGKPIAQIQKSVGRWFAMSSLTGRYSASPETAIEQDIRNARQGSFADYANDVYAAQFGDTFWEVMLPRQLETASSTSPAFRVFLAAQVKLQDRGFLTNEFSVGDLIKSLSNVHHVFPADFLKKQGLDRTRYNQVANFVVMPTEINIQISNKEPRVYFGHLHEQVSGGQLRYGTITDPAALQKNLLQNCIPPEIAAMGIDEYPAFLAERRKLMAQKIRTYFEAL
ncbi:MAG TPA: DUF262 domain-containing protein [Thermomicrobiales bacterium]|nr:DUF262 domain-containing protein [Thermomicrobiales bacterium]